MNIDKGEFLAIVQKKPNAIWGKTIDLQGNKLGFWSYGAEETKIVKDLIASLPDDSRIIWSPTEDPEGYEGAVCGAEFVDTCAYLYGDKFIVPLLEIDFYLDGVLSEQMIRWIARLDAGVSFLYDDGRYLASIYME